MDASDRGLFYFADPMCSWCWGFSPVMKALMGVFRDQLALTLVMGGLRAGNTASMAPAMRQEILHHWRDVAERSGQPFSFDGALPDGFVYDTEPPCRAVVAMRQLKRDTAFPLLEALQHAFYVDQKDVTWLETLVELAVGVGAERERFQEMFESDVIKTKTKSDFDFAHRLGIRGFPSLVFKDARGYRLLTGGYQSLDRLQPIAERWLADSDHAVDRSRETDHP